MEVLSQQPSVQNKLVGHLLEGKISLSCVSLRKGTLKAQVHVPWGMKVQKDFIYLIDALYVQVNDQALMMTFQDCYILELAHEAQLQCELCREKACEISG